MTKAELLTKIDQRVNDLFSSYDFYNKVKDEAVAAYDKYVEEKELEPSFTLLNDFINENVMKTAISTAMHETIELLVEEGIISDK